ncbi:MAG: FMN-binding protein [Eubacteriales bacterium]|nr:FMN-binding protein [Eubacteriales bacterium]
MKKLIQILTTTLLLSLLLCGCSTSHKMKDGYYTAEMSDFSHGWKEYVCILVKNDKIVSAEFNAKDPSGFIKAWDNEYMRNMSTIQSTYPNKYTREYVKQLMEGQKNTEVDIVSGATSSGNNFEKLIAAVIKQAQKGDSEVTIVPSEEE